MDRTTTAAAIIAGGRARRFAGRDKSRLVVEGRPIIIRQVEALQPVAGEIFIIADDAARFADLGLRVVPDAVPGAGALGGLFTALSATRADAVLTVACDLPFLDAGLLAHLVALASTRDGAWVRTLRGVEPLLACYRRGAASRMRDAIAAGRLRAGALNSILDLAEVGPGDLARFGPVDRLLANINTPDDYARVQYRPA